MSIIDTAIYFGIINFFFYFLWEWIVQPLTQLFFKLLHMTKWGIRGMRFITGYFIVSTFVLLTHFILNESSSTLEILLYPIFISLFIFISHNCVYQERRRNAYDSNVFANINATEREMMYEVFLGTTAMTAYLVMLFIVPSAASNIVTRFIFGTMLWIHAIPVFGIIIAVWGIALYLKTFFIGIVAARSLPRIILKRQISQ